MNTRDLLPIDILKSSSDFLNLLLNSLTAAVFVVDKDAKIYSVNDAMTTIFYRQPEEFIGNYCGNALGCSNVVNSDLTCGKSNNCAACRLRLAIVKSIQDHQDTVHQIFKRSYYIKKKLINKIFRFSSRHLYFQGIDLAVIIFDDITALERQKRRLIQMNKEKNRILGMAAHDLRNPLSVISIYSSLLLEDKELTLSDEQTTFLTRIYKTSQTMANMISDMLDISAIESGLVQLLPEKQNYTIFLTGIIETNRIIAANKSIQIEFHADTTLPEFSFDKNKIEQVLNNLIYNAVKYSYPDTTLTITTYCKDQQVYTSVKDQGIGIAKDEQDLIFKPFTKTSNKATANEHSTGLGLAITKRIVEAHQGTIYLENSSAEGSTFVFTLPYNESEN